MEASILLEKKKEAIKAYNEFSKAVKAFLAEKLNENNNKPIVFDFYNTTKDLIAKYNPTLDKEELEEALDDFWTQNSYTTYYTDGQLNSYICSIDKIEVISLGEKCGNIKVTLTDIEWRDEFISDILTLGEREVWDALVYYLSELENDVKEWSKLKE